MAVQPFGVKAENAIANLRGKVPVETERWNDMLGPMHATSFTVAGAPLDVVKDIHAALVRAQESGTTLTQFGRTSTRSWNARVGRIVGSGAGALS